MALLVHEGVPLGGWSRRLGATAAGLALGGALAAVQMFPGVELAAVGSRATGALAEPAMLPFGPELGPGLFTLYRGTITGGTLAFGAVVLGLAAGALAAPGYRALGVWALVVGALAALWSLGRFTPLFEVYLWLPVLSWFRFPSRILVVFDFCIAVAAAIGLAAVTGAWDRGDGRRRAGAVVLVLAGLGLVANRIAVGWVPAGSEAGAFAFTVAAAVLAVAAIALPRRGPVLAAAFVAVAAVEIARHPWTGVRLPYGSGHAEWVRADDDEFEHLAIRAGHDRVWYVLAGMLPENALKRLAAYRVRSVFDYEPVNLRRQAEYFTYLGEGSTVRTRWPFVFSGDVGTLVAPPGVAPLAARRRLLDLASVRWVVMRPGTGFAPGVGRLFREARMERQADGGRLIVARNPSALPRAFVTYRTRPASPSPDLLLAELARPTFDPLAGSFVEGPPPFPQAPDPPRGHPATFVRDDETVVELDVELVRPGLVVLGDTYYPGWRATVDGAPAPIVATNHLFRGVPAPAGKHRVRFAYRPTSVVAGAATSVAALLLILWLARPRRARRARPR